MPCGTCCWRSASPRVEVGFPAASQPDFDFIRRIIDEDRIPEGVSIQILCQAREELIERSVEALAGCTVGDLSSLQLHFRAAAAGGVRHGPAGHCRSGRERHGAGEGRAEVASIPTSPSSTRRRASPAPSSILRWRSPRRLPIPGEPRMSHPSSSTCLPRWKWRRRTSTRIRSSGSAGISRAGIGSWSACTLTTIGAPAWPPPSLR